MKCNTDTHLKQINTNDLLNEFHTLIRHRGFPENIIAFLDRDIENARQAYANPCILYPNYDGEVFTAWYGSPEGRTISFTFNIEVLLAAIEKSNLTPIEHNISKLVARADVFYDNTATHISSLAESTTPIIMLPFADQHIVVDGNKRLTARLKNELPTIDVYFLGEIEAMLALHSKAAQYLYRFLLHFNKFERKLIGV